MDPEGADGFGNPIGGLVYSNSLGSSDGSEEQVSRWLAYVCIVATYEPSFLMRYAESSAQKSFVFDGASRMSPPPTSALTPTMVWAAPITCLPRFRTAHWKVVKQIQEIERVSSLDQTEKVGISLLSLRNYFC
jgi:hypothetical protein